MKLHCKFAAFRAESSRHRSTRSLATTFSVLFTSLFLALPALTAQTAKPSPSIPKQSAPTQASTSLADQPPTAAAVSFRNGNLTIKAHNSDLLQILQTITAQTGMKVQGAPGSHRIFGVYGPGRPREVLSQLLSGFDFNYLLVGTAHNGAPHTLILAGKAPTGPPPPRPVQSVQPAPQNAAPRGQYHPSPFYRPQPRPSPHAQPKGQSPHKPQASQHPRTPQEILKELEAMHAKQKQGSSH